MELNRRTFLKGAAVAAAAVTMSSLLAGCGETNGDLVADATGLNSVADLQGIQMKVTYVGTVYDSATGCAYVVPTVKITNNGVMPLQVDPLNGSFSIVLPDKREMTLNADTMARISTSSTLKPLKAQTVTRGKSTEGELCASGSGMGGAKYIYIIYYPYATDKTMYLRCRIGMSQIEPMMGF